MATRNPCGEIFLDHPLHGWYYKNLVHLGGMVILNKGPMWIKCRDCEYKTFSSKQTNDLCIFCGLILL